MRQPRSAIAELLIVTALAGLALLTLVDRGATRIYATPWNGLFWFVQLAPILALTLRAVFASDSLTVPPRVWSFFLGGLVAAIEWSAVLSPHRGVSALSTCEPVAAVASFFLLVDWLARGGERNAARLLRVAAWFSCLVVVSSIGQWVYVDLWPALGRSASLAELARIQNAHPLGHTSYTAGLALVIMPWPALLAIWSTGKQRYFWAAVSASSLVMLLSSGSRGGVIGITALLLVAVWLARWSWRRTLLTSLGALLITTAGAYAHPRTRALFFERHANQAPNLSNVQRSAMARAGWLMGRERPLIGWGNGTTSRVYPKFRAQLDGGVESALQLHSTPVQLWADYGLAGVVGVTGLVILTLAAAVRGRQDLGPGKSRGTFDAAVLTLAGYGAFSLTDYQLDVPVFAFAIAASVACLAGRMRGEGTPPTGLTRLRTRNIVAAGALSPLLLMAVLGKSDPAPEMNVRALQWANDTAKADDAIALLRDSLRLDPDQEIAHFNLGWLLVVRDPAEAERHFLAAARLVPDKGGVYFGLALARINRSTPADTQKAARALALECLNDPIFLVSPWWQTPALSSLRSSAVKDMRSMAKAISTDEALRHKSYVQDEAAYLAALSEWLAGARSNPEVLLVANTPARKTYFSGSALPPDFSAAKVRRYRRERIGYPVLMRDLDLPAPVDVFDVQENDLAAGELRFLFPAKGWVPSPELLKLLQ